MVFRGVSRFLIGMLSVFMLSVFMLSVFMLSVFMLGVFMLSVVMLNVGAPLTTISTLVHYLQARLQPTQVEFLIGLFMGLLELNGGRNG